MKTEADIRSKINDFEKQKNQLADVSRIEGAKVADIATAIVFIEKQISLLKWVLS